jgi:hypothetical protein
MLFSLIKGVDFFENSLIEGGKKSPGMPYIGVTLKFWYRHGNPKI